MDKAEAKELQRSMNPKTILALVENDCDLSKPRPIINVFYSGNSSCETRLKHELVDSGFNVHRIEMTNPTNEQSEYCFEVIIIHSIDRNWIDNLTDTCIEVASKCCAEYDGWYTELD